MTRINREHILQTAIARWQREAILTPHEFMAFDRSAPTGQFTHAREANRGILPNTPDTLLLADGFRPLWVELKYPPNKVVDGDDQHKMGTRLIATGCNWDWVLSVEAYHRVVAALGYRLAANAEFLAMQGDAHVASLIAQAELKAGKTPRAWKVREEKPTPARLRKIARARATTMF